ncbi:MAG: hypothetical protein HOQ02_01490 [Lysobacter sp.]|nr:hypothetical protein [Lysobacter sp.]
MNTTRLAPLVLLALPFVGACERPHASAPPAQAAASAQPETVLGKTVASALDKARKEMETGNINLNHGVDVDVGDHGHHFRIGGNDRDGKPSAEITPQGDLLVDGRQADVTPAQRALLLQYRQQTIGLAEAGMAVGVKGADLAGKALAETFSGLIHGNADAAGKHIQAEGEKLKADARQICAQLPGMLQTQQQLATSLPAFKPYATMTQQDVDDCMKDDKGVAVTSADGGFGEQVRQAVHDNIRDNVRAATHQPPDAADTAAASKDSAARP